MMGNDPTTQAPSHDRLQVRYDRLDITNFETL